MTSQLIFHSCHLYVLIDYNVTHSFISRGIIERLGLELTFVVNICIEMLDRDKILSNQMLLGEIM